MKDNQLTDERGMLEHLDDDVMDERPVGNILIIASLCCIWSTHLTKLSKLSSRSHLNPQKRYFKMIDLP